jgi:hypothetical protein
MEAGTKAYLFSFAPIVVGGLIVWGALYYWRSGRELRANGVTTLATVVETHRYSRGSDVYVLRFADPSGVPRTVEIGNYRGGRLREGNTAHITYIPAHPEKAEWGLKLGAYIMGWVALVVAACGGWMVVLGLYQVFGLLTGKLNPANL